MCRRVPPLRSAGIRAGFVLPAVLAGLFALAGCGDGTGKKDSVTGKVTLNGQPVAGEVAFTGAGNKTVRSPIGADGTYTILDPVKGENSIIVKGMGQAPQGKGGPAMPGMPSSTGVPPPAKYAQPNNGLKVTVTGGKQTHDLPLSP